MARNLLKTVCAETNNTPSGRVFNFGAGPAMLPAEVMQKAQSELLDWQGTGMSVMEMNHRSDEFVSIAKQAESDLREVLLIPENYRVLFLQGGATSQFSMVPLNLLQGGTSADYIHTGLWSGKALAEARRFCRVNIVASSEANHFQSIPEPSSWNLEPAAAYVFYTANETVNGVEFNFIPDVGHVPLVTDMTSNLFSCPLDVSRFGVIFAGTQKNAGIAGLVIVIVREDLIGKAQKNIPGLYDYAIQDRESSMFNTPPTFSWYMTGLVLQWIKDQGGLSVMADRAKRKSEKLYRAIDNSDIYQNCIDLSCRSRMNIPFRLVDENFTVEFLSEAAENGLTALAGHRSVGGMRASIYNAMPEAGVDELINFMSYFEQHCG